MGAGHSVSKLVVFQKPAVVKPIVFKIWRQITMNDLKLTPEMVPVIKLARLMKIPYSWISGYYPGLNFGRIADVIKGRLYPDIPPASELPADFPRA